MSARCKRVLLSRVASPISRACTPDGDLAPLQWKLPFVSAAGLTARPSCASFGHRCLVEYGENMELTAKLGALKDPL